MAKNQKSSFQIKPLDINIVKILTHLRKKYLDKTPPFENFEEIYTNLDTRINLSYFEISCVFDNDNAQINLTYQNKYTKNDNTVILFEGNAENFRKYLTKTAFFYDCKESMKVV